MLVTLWGFQGLPTDENFKEKQADFSKRGKTRVTKAQLILVLNLIG